MKWGFGILGVLLLLVGAIYFGVESTYAKQFPDGNSVIQTVFRDTPVRSVDAVDRSTGRVPCYVLHGKDTAGKSYWIFATTNHVLLTEPEEKIKSQANAVTIAKNEISGLVPTRTTLEILLPGIDPVDISNLYLNEGDTSWHIVWETFGYRIKTNGSKEYVILDMDARTGQVLRQFNLKGVSNLE